jgi:hypothetical protein
VWRSEADPAREMEVEGERGTTWEEVCNDLTFSCSVSLCLVIFRSTVTRVCSSLSADALHGTLYFTARVLSGARLRWWGEGEKGG